MHCVLSIAILSLACVNALPAVPQYDVESFSTLAANSTSSVMTSVTDVYEPLTRRDNPFEPKPYSIEPSAFTNIYWAVTTHSHLAAPAQPSKPAPHRSAPAEQKPGHRQHQPEHPKAASRRQTVTLTKVVVSTRFIEPAHKATKSRHHTVPRQHPATSTKVEMSTIAVEPVPKTALSSHHATPKPSVKPEPPSPRISPSTSGDLTIVPITPS